MQQVVTPKNFPTPTRVVIIGGGMMGTCLLLGYCCENLIQYFARIAQLHKKSS